MMRSFFSKGFSLLEGVLALAIISLGLSALWTLVLGVQQTAQDKVIAQQMLVVGRAAQAYININQTSLKSTLLAVGTKVQIRIRDSDTGEVTLPSLVGSGLLPSGFANSFAYGQTYSFYVFRQDAGAVGLSADDFLEGLVLTSSGSALKDKQGARIASLIGPSGGFVFSSDTTKAQGSFGGWLVDLSLWSLTPGAGQLALLTKLADEGVRTRGATGASTFNELSDSITDTANAAFYLGMYAGQVDTLFSSSMGIGYKAGMNLSPSGSGPVAVGAYAWSVISNDQNNVVLGSRVFENAANTAKYVVAAGYKSGNLLKGASNVFLGSLSGTNLSAVPALSFDIALGYNAYSGSASTTGSRNLLIGSGSLSAATTLAYSIAVGKDAANAAVDNTYLLAVGSQAGYLKRRSNSTWQNQYIAIGSRAFYSTVGSQSGTSKGIAVGEKAAYLGTGASLVALGAGALGNSAALSSMYENLGIGYQAGYNNVNTTSAIVSLGYKAAYAQGADTYSDNSVIAGSSANQTNGSVFNSVVLGANARTFDSGVTIGSKARGLSDPPVTETGLVALGYKAGYLPTSRALSLATIAGSGSIMATSAASSDLGAVTAAGYQSLYKYANYNASVSPHIIAMGWRSLAGYENQAASSSASIAIGKNSGYVVSAVSPIMAVNTTGKNLILLGSDISTPASSTSNYMMLGTAIRTDLTTRQSVIGGTGDETPLAAGSSDLYVVGNMIARNYFYTSDRRLKKDIKPLSGMLEKVSRIKPVSFVWKKDGSKSIGVIAQDLLDIFPELVNRSTPESWSVDYCSFVSPVLAAAQEQTQLLKALEIRSRKLDEAEQQLMRQLWVRLAARASEQDLALLRAELSRREALNAE